MDSPLTYHFVGTAVTNFSAPGLQTAAAGALAEDARGGHHPPANGDQPLVADGAVQSMMFVHDLVGFVSGCL